LPGQFKAKAGPNGKRDVTFISISLARKLYKEQQEEVWPFLAFILLACFWLLLLAAC